MHSHSPNDLQGPIRGTPGWWQETGKSDADAPDVQAAPARKKRSKKSGHRNYARAPGDAPVAGAIIRADLVDRVRREIEDGTYETTEKWEAALDRLLENL